MTTPYRTLPEIPDKEKPTGMWIHKLFGLHNWEPMYDMPELGSSMSIEEFLHSVKKLRCSQCDKIQVVCWDRDKGWESRANNTVENLTDPDVTVKHIDVSEVAPRSLGEFLTMYSLVSKEYEYLRDTGWIKLVDKPD